MSSILDRIDRQLAGLEARAGLEALSARDLNSLLLHVLGRRARQTAPHQLLDDRALWQPSSRDLRKLRRVEAQALEAARGFEALELSPVAPLGSAQTLSGIDPNNVLAGLRGSEVVSDPTLSLALEMARRRRRGQNPVHLCTSHRVVRLQPFKAPGLVPHFRIFALAGTPDLRKHLEVYLELLKHRSVRVDLTPHRLVTWQLRRCGVSREEVDQLRTHDFPTPEELQARFRLPLGRCSLDEAAKATPGHGLAELREVIEPLQRAFPQADIGLDLARLTGLGYYRDVSLRVWLDGQNVADGGLVDWVGRLLGQRGERMLISGIGVDRLCDLLP